MITIITFCVLLTYSSFALNLNDAILKTYFDQPIEVLKEEKSKDASTAQAVQSVDSFLPNPSLYYNFTQPGTPTFSSPINTNGGNFPVQFITGFTQKQYGIGIDYNIVSISQLINKISAVSTAKTLANSQMMSAKSLYVYNLAETYIALYRTKEMLYLQEKIYETAKRRAADLQTLFQYGKVSKIDMLASESDFLKSAVSIENFQNAFLNAKQKYTDIFHSTPPEDMSLPEIKLSDIAPTLQILKEKIYQNYDVSSIQNTAKGLKIESQIAGLGLLPKVTLGYRHNFTNPDKNLNIPNYRQSIFSINASVDLLNIRDFFSKKQLDVEYQKKVMESDILLKKYLTEAEDLWNAVKYYENMEATMQKVVKNTEEIHKITKNEVMYGLKTFTDELLAKQNYYNAKLDLLETQLQKVIKIYRLKLLTNQIIPNSVIH